jgi:hypothetical protein
MKDRGRIMTIGKNETRLAEKRETVYLIERHDLDGGTHYYRQITRGRHTWTLDPHAAARFQTRKGALAGLSIDPSSGPIDVGRLHIVKHIFGLDLHD